LTVESILDILFREPGQTGTSSCLSRPYEYYFEVFGFNWRLIRCLVISAVLSSCATLVQSNEGDLESLLPTSTTITDTTTTVAPLAGQVPTVDDSPNLKLTSYEGWSYTLRTNLSGLDLSFEKIIADSAPGRAKMSIDLVVPDTFPGTIFVNPAGNPGRNIPTPQGGVYVVVNDVKGPELLMDYGRAFFGLPCGTFTGTGLDDFVPSKSHRLFCGELGIPGAVPITGPDSYGITEETSEDEIDSFIGRFSSLRVDVWVNVAGCLIVFSKGRPPFTLGSPSGGPNKCAIAL
jgi:hypothetical protein